MGTPAEGYLRGRGSTGAIPPTLRYHPALLHPDIGQHLPAVVAAVANVERKVKGIQRTYLTLTGRKAPLSRPKMALGALRGGAVGPPPGMGVAHRGRRGRPGRGPDDAGGPGPF